MHRYFATSLFALLLSLPAMAAPLKVVTSIYPLQLIAQSVLGPRAEVTTLLANGQSPHNFAFKVSDRQKLTEADLLLWVGPQLEPYLSDIAASQPSLAMNHELAITTDDTHDGHHHGNDPHLWLSVHEIEAFTRLLVAQIAELDSQDQDQLIQRAERFIRDVKAVPTSYENTNKPKTYAVAHRAYDHFLQSFPFAEPVVLSDSPEVSPGAKTLWRASQELTRGSCLIVDGSTTQRWLKAFAQRNGLVIKQVDLMGVTAEVSTYKELITGLADVFKSCSEKREGE